MSCADYVESSSKESCMYRMMDHKHLLNKAQSSGRKEAVYLAIKEGNMNITNTNS
jgi:hypothetical protein